MPEIFSRRDPLAVMDQAGIAGELLEALNARKATVFIHPAAPACFESFGLSPPAPMIEFPLDGQITAPGDPANTRRTRDRQARAEAAA
jgi:hypothetical protein